MMRAPKKPMCSNIEVPSKRVHAKLHLCPPPQMLPDEMLIAILSRIPLPVRIKHAQLVSKRWMSLCGSPDMWERVELRKDVPWPTVRARFLDGDN